MTGVALRGGDAATVGCLATGGCFAARGVVLPKVCDRLIPSPSALESSTLDDSPASSELSSLSLMLVEDDGGIFTCEVFEEVARGVYVEPLESASEEEGLAVLVLGLYPGLLLALCARVIP